MQPVDHDIAKTAEQCTEDEAEDADEGCHRKTLHPLYLMPLPDPVFRDDVFSFCQVLVSAFKRKTHAKIGVIRNATHGVLE